MFFAFMPRPIQFRNVLNFLTLFQQHQAQLKDDIKERKASSNKQTDFVAYWLRPSFSNRQSILTWNHELFILNPN